MTQKFTLSVPNELAAKIEERRDYLGNLSAIFQKAVQAKIQQKEDFEQRMKGDASMNEIIERLRGERRQEVQDCRSQGLDDGLEWAQAASYRELKYAAVHFKMHDDLYGRPLAPNVLFGDEVLGDYLSEKICDDPLMAPEEGYDLDTPAVEWLSGWLEAVQGFWSEVYNKVHQD